MDPHSRLSQFNQRGPKSGPLLASRFVSEAMHKPSLETFTSTPPPTATAKRKSTPILSTPPSAHLVRRPIATNSRIKQNEDYRKDMYLAFVKNALKQKSNGNSEPYNELVNQFDPKCRSNPSSTDSPTSLRTWILALTHIVSRLERVHSNLVEAIINMPWTTLDSATVKSYTVFVGMLLSARPEYLSLVLGKIAQGFTYQSGLQTLSQAFPESSSSPVTRRVIYDRLHYLLQHLLNLVPTLPSTLQPLLVRHFPHKRQSQLTQSTYIRNLLRVSSYCPELSDKVLATIVDRAIQIDVEIQVELEELEDADVSEEQPLFEIDPFDVVLGQEDHDASDLSDGEDSVDDVDDGFSDLSSEGGGDIDGEAIPELPTNMNHIQDMVKKLDSILMLMFEHLERAHTNGTTGSKHTPHSPPLESLSLPPLPPISSYSPLTSPATPSPSLSFLTREQGQISALESPPPTMEPATSQNTTITTRTQFNTLLSIFDRIILRTFKSRYTQFLLFWFTSLDPEFADIFQGMLVERALLGPPSALSRVPDQFSEGRDDDGSNGASNANGSTITRAAAASYIGSFVSRAVFVDADGARRVIAVFCEFLRAHLDEVEESTRTFSSPVVVGGPQHTVFYAVTQAVFLIFCFRWRDLLNLEEDDGGDVTIHSANMAGQRGSGAEGKMKKWMPELEVLHRVVNSALNPLKVCSFNVVMQFARVARAADFIYCYSILESNKRLEPTSAPTNTAHPSATSSIVNGLNKSDPSSAVAELNTFFPFDPYRLPKSAAFIKDVYRDWSSVAIDNESDDEEESEEEGGLFGADEIADSTLGSSPEDPHDFLPVPRSGKQPGSIGRGSATEGDRFGEISESLEQMSISPGHGGQGIVFPSTSVMSIPMR